MNAGLTGSIAVFMSSLSFFIGVDRFVTVAHYLYSEDSRLVTPGVIHFLKTLVPVHISLYLVFPLIIAAIYWLLSKHTAENKSSVLWHGIMIMHASLFIVIALIVANYFVVTGFAYTVEITSAQIIVNIIMLVLLVLWFFRVLNRNKQ